VTWWSNSDAGYTKVSHGYDEGVYEVFEPKIQKLWKLPKLKLNLSGKVGTDPLKIITSQTPMGLACKRDKIKVGP